MKHLKLISLVLLAILLSSIIYSQSNTCTSLEPICTDVGLNFPAQTGVADASTTDPGNNYSCLASSPNTLAPMSILARKALTICSFILPSQIRSM